MNKTSYKPLFALALAAFGIGTTEFVIMGLLPQIAVDLKVSMPSAGLLVSGYALGVAAGGPLLALLVAKLPRRRSLIALMALFIAGNIGCSLAPRYGWLMIARIVTALCHSAFFGVGAVMAAGLAPAGKQARAIAVMISGLTLANVMGVPLGTTVGQIAGWRVTFLCVVVVGILALSALILWVPSEADRRPDLRAELGSIRAPVVWLTLAISVIASTSMFYFFTYITPILIQVSGIPATRVSWVLLACGLGLTVGNILGARLADWRPQISVAIALILTATVLFAFTWFEHIQAAAVALVTLWGSCSFSLCAMLQAEAVRHASRAPNIASTLNISSFNLGNAIGACLAALSLNRGLPLSCLPAIAGLIALLGFMLTLPWIGVSVKG
jgi:DHA1 family inner membrane transport protein